MPFYDIAWTFGWIIILLVMAVALLSLGAARGELGVFWSTVWCVAIVLLPLLGQAAWFIYRGAGLVRRQRASAAAGDVHRGAELSRQR